MLLRLIFILVVVFLVPQFVAACMCGGTSVCQAYSTSDAVVIATVANYENTTVKESIQYEGKKVETFETPGQKVTLTISRWYKGRGGKQFVLMQPNSSCDWEFSDGNLGKTYLLYLRKNMATKAYSVVSCGRSSELSKAGLDRSWLNGLPKSLDRTVILGQVRLNDDANTFPPVENTVIAISGIKKEFKTKSNKRGFYAIWDVPAGQYRVTSQVPNGFQMAWTVSVPDNWHAYWDGGDDDPKALDVTIEPGKCGGVDFMFERKKL